LETWHENDDPWEDHLKWSQDCLFLKMVGFDNTFKRTEKPAIKPPTPFVAQPPTTAPSTVTFGFPLVNQIHQQHNQWPPHAPSHSSNPPTAQPIGTIPQQQQQQQPNMTGWKGFSQPDGNTLFGKPNPPSTAQPMTTVTNAQQQPNMTGWKGFSQPGGGGNTLFGKPNPPPTTHRWGSTPPSIPSNMFVGKGWMR
jgi:hypothetical protein